MCRSVQKKQENGGRGEGGHHDGHSQEREGERGGDEQAGRNLKESKVV